MCSLSSRCFPLLTLKVFVCAFISLCFRAEKDQGVSTKPGFKGILTRLHIVMGI